MESFHLHYVVLCLANAKINTLLADSTVSEKSVSPKKSHSDVSRLFNLVFPTKKETYHYDFPIKISF